MRAERRSEARHCSIGALDVPVLGGIFIATLALVFVLVGRTPPAMAEPVSAEDVGRRLVAAYPQFLSAIENGHLVWKDGTRMPIDDAHGPKSPKALLDNPDIKDMFAWRYPAGQAADAPSFEIDPGRVRYQPLFDKMYGDCMKGETTSKLVEIVWLPKKARQRLKVTRINGVAERLEAVSRALDALPAEKWQELIQFGLAAPDEFDAGKG